MLFVVTNSMHYMLMYSLDTRLAINNGCYYCRTCYSFRSSWVFPLF